VLLKATHYLIFSDDVPRFIGCLMFRISPFDIDIFSKSSRKFANCGESRKRKLFYLLTSCFLYMKCHVTFAPYYISTLRKENSISAFRIEIYTGWAKSRYAVILCTLYLLLTHLLYRKGSLIGIVTPGVEIAF
jgi:hypothetical protein